jgi:hypothetical protein
MDEKYTGYNELLEAQGYQLVSDQILEKNYIAVLAPDSHVHHGMEPELVNILSETDLTAIVPNSFGALEIHAQTDNPQPCYCVKVEKDDKVILAYRGNRKYPSPVLTNKGPTLSNDMTIILKDTSELKDSLNLEHAYVVRTAYIGPSMPPEPLSDKIDAPDVHQSAKEESYAAWGKPGSWKMAMVPEPGEIIYPVESS